MLDVFKRGDDKRREESGREDLYDVTDRHSKELEKQRAKEFEEFNKPNLYAGKNYPTVMDSKKTRISLGAGAALTAGALGYWLYRRNPEKMRMAKMKESLWKRRSV